MEQSRLDRGFVLTKKHKLVLDLIRTFEGPVEHEILQWGADYGDSQAGFSELGPRPRRAELLTCIGDLVDHQLVSQSPEGFESTYNMIPFE